MSGKTQKKAGALHSELRIELQPSTPLTPGAGDQSRMVSHHETKL